MYANGTELDEAKKAAEEMQAAFESLQGEIRGALEGAFDADTRKEFRDQFNVGIDEIIKKQLIAGLADPQIAELAKFIQEAIASDGLDAAEIAEIEQRKRRILREAQATYDEIAELFPGFNPDDVPKPVSVAQTEVNFSRVPESIQLAVATPLLEASLNDLSASKTFVDAANTFSEAVSGGFGIDTASFQSSVNQLVTTYASVNTFYQRLLNEGITVHTAPQQGVRERSASRTLLYNS